MPYKKEDCLWVTTLEGAFGRWGYLVRTDTEGNIIDITLDCEKLGNEEEMFKVIAPFVKKGSYIQISGDNGKLWRWVFDGTTMKNIKAKVSWNSEEGLQDTIKKHNSEIIGDIKLENPGNIAVIIHNNRKYISVNDLSLLLMRIANEYRKKENGHAAGILEDVVNIISMSNHV